MKKWMTRTLAVAVILAVVENSSVEAICDYAQKMLHYLPSLQQVQQTAVRIVPKIGDFLREMSSFL